MSAKQSIETIQADFEKLLRYNAAVHNSMTYYRMGILSEVDAFKLAIITLSQQIENLEDQIGSIMLNRRYHND